jgi:hypothetical protein
MSARQLYLEKRIDRIKEKIATLGDLRPGALSEQYNVCGNPRCRCKATPPQKHGPYFQLSYTWEGKSTSQFVPKDSVPQVKQQLRNYRRLRELVDQWITLAMELSRLKSNPPALPREGKSTKKSRKLTPQSIIPNKKLA